MWRSQIKIDEVCEIRARSTVYLGVGAIEKIEDICAVLKTKQISRVVVVTGKSSYIKSGAWEYVTRAFERNVISHALYNKVTPNPTVDQVDEATSLGRSFGAQAVLAIGGGSPIDAAKSVAVLLEYPQRNARELFENKFTPEKAVPIVTINLTHGTGTEADRFAVVSIPEKQAKPVLVSDFIYPLYSIDDPALMVGLPPDQTAYVSIDAVNHVIEASTSIAATPFSILLARETIRLIVQYLPDALKNPQDLTARYYLLYASLIAGISFDNGLLHYTHALEHPLSAVKPELAHGLGLAILVQSVVKQIYPASSKVLADILSPIVGGLTGDAGEADKVFEGLKKWLIQMGVKPGLDSIGFKLSDIEKLTRLAFDTPSLKLLLSLAPVEASHTIVSRIYMDSF
ncbi:MAG TPA: iron-containing alcohol dehydrogenase [Chitinispirillaceae bacterium]|nr:iron-containing alcohol dehydrogenase [Chitinispirillaceae bacterium]